MSHPLHIGAFVPQGWKTELEGIEGAAARWERTVEIAVLAEALGYDSIWVYDHFHNVPRPAHATVFECWTVLAALSQRTTRVRLGQMVSCNSYRQPSVVAKITSTLDVLSGGRLEFGIGAGWYEHEYAGDGFEFPEPKVRIAMLEEAVEIVRALWTQPETTFDGTYYRTAAAHCDPKPLQQPHPPIWIGGGGEQLTLRVVARHADVANFGGNPEEWRHKASVVREHCRAVGRDPDAIRLSWSPEVFVRETEAEIVEAGSRSLWGEPFESWRAGNLVGTPEQVAEKIELYRSMGCSGFVPWCADYPSDQTLRLFAERVVAELR